MQKKILPALILSALPLALHADRKPLVLTTYSGYNVTGVSPNGKWAVGTYTGGDDTYYAFRWNLKTNEIEMLSSNSDESEGNNISNDGVVACNFYDSEATKNGAPALSGGWWDGEFHHIQTVGDAYATSREGSTRALAVSSDGTWLGGAAYNDANVRVAAVWHNGQLAWTAQESVTGRALAVSNDGKMAAGWSTPKSAGGGRVATLWKEGEECVYLSSSTSGAPWYTCWQFSDNGKYLLYFKSYYDDSSLASGMGINAIYDIAEGTTTGVPTITAEPQNIELFSISDDGTVVGYEQPDDDMQRAFICQDGTSQWLIDYVQEKGVMASDIDSIGQSDDGTLWLYTANGISADGKVIVARYYDTDTNTRSVAFLLDEEYSLREPVQVQASQLTDTKAVKVEWLEPLTEADKVTGYNIWRDGTKVNTTPVDTLYYYDAVPSAASYQYNVTAVYEAGESDKSETAVVTVSEKGIEPPTRLFARQTRLCNAIVQWEKPESNLTVKKYFSDDNEISGFGASGESFEGAIRFEEADLAFYQGKKLSAVTFYPLSEQNGWTINIYKKDKDSGALELLATQPVSQTLSYGQKNEIRLEAPVSIPESGDLYVAVSVNSKSTAGDNVIGIVYGLINPELSDLARLSGEEDFYSIYTTSLSSGNPFTFTWAIGAVLGDETASSDIDEVKQYNVYDGDNKLVSTAATQKELENLSEGSHTFAVEAEYADGRISPKSAVSLNISPDTGKYYKSVEDVNVVAGDGAAISATWKAPADDDATIITYADESAGDGPVGPEDNAYNFQAAADYPSSMLKGLEGYQITSLRFFPLCNADFTLTLQADGEEIAQTMAESYELNDWNDVQLASPVTIEAGKAYRLIVDIYDTEEGVPALGFDAQVPFMGQSDLYSSDEGENFSSIYNGASVYGNWKIGFTAVSPDVKELPVNHYVVSIDGKATDDGTVTETAYNYDFGTEDASRHSIRVDAVYDDYGTVRGGVTYFYIGKYSAIEEATVPTLHVSTEGGVLIVNDNVTSLEIFEANGRRAATAAGNKIDISRLAKGTYILSAKLCNETEQSYKFIVTR